MPAAESSRTPERRDSELSTPAAGIPRRSSGGRWFQLRGRVLLLALLAVVAAAGIFVPRQLRQARAIAALKAYPAAAVRTQPIALLGLEAFLPPRYADEIVEVYWRDPNLDERQLQALNHLGTLEKLELSGSNVTGEGLGQLKGLRRLYMLHLADTPITDAGLIQLPRFRSLEVLSLDNTAVTDAGLVHLEKLPQLERLYLDRTGVTDAGLASLGKLSGLKELSLVGTSVSDAGLQHLKNLRNLEMLKLYRTRVTQAGLDEMHQALPQCVVWVPTE